MAGAASAARTDQDGVDTGGMAGIPMGRIADVEMNEFSYPMLYLWRREEPDSGGPGRFRGGVGGSSCFILHRSPRLPCTWSSPVAARRSRSRRASRAATPRTPSWTWPSAARTSVRSWLRADIPTSLDEIAGQRVVMPPHLETFLGEDDVYYMPWQGGGGYGDPLQRDPTLVEADLRAGKVTAGAATDVYGVITSPGSGAVDAVATDERRRGLRAERLAAATPRAPRSTR